MAEALRDLAREVGVPVTTLADATPDVAIDGADQAAPLLADARCLVELPVLAPAHQLGLGPPVAIDTGVEHRASGLVGVEPEGGVDVFPGDGVGILLGDRLDVDAAALGDHRDRLALAAVHRHADVQFVDEVDGRLDQHAVDVQPLQVHPEDVVRGLAEFLLVVDQLDAAGLPAPADLYLRLHRAGVADRVGRRDGLLDGRRELRIRHREPGVPEDPLRLVLVKLHHPNRGPGAA